MRVQGYGPGPTKPNTLTDLSYNGVRLCFLLPGWAWHDREEERGIGTGSVEGVEPELRATGGSELPRSISDRRGSTCTPCWEGSSHALRACAYNGPQLLVTQLHDGGPLVEAQLHNSGQLNC